MTRRDEMLAVCRERDNEIVRHLVKSWQIWNPLAWYHAREARRLTAMNQRDLEALPPERYRKPRAAAANIRRVAP